MNRSNLYIVIAVIVAVASIAAAVKEVQSSEAAPKASASSSSAEPNRCLDVPRQLRDGIASSLKPGVRLGTMQAVKSNETWHWAATGESETVYWVAAALDGPKLYSIGTWSVFRSLGPDSGLVWVGDDEVAKVSNYGVDVPFELRRSVPDDGFNEAQDCVDAD
jgi:hypothetical protein